MAARCPRRDAAARAAPAPRGRMRRAKALVACLAVCCTVAAAACIRRGFARDRRTSNEPHLEHFRRNRSLGHYMDRIGLLAEPASTPCDGLGDVPLVVLVASAPPRHRQRDAIRLTWGRHFPTYFVSGLDAPGGRMESVRLEAKQFDDMIIYDYRDHYQNLTLKTALMLRWTRHRCAYAGFMLKADDDVLLNPWTLTKVLKEQSNAMLIGYKLYDSVLIRDKYQKWYLPRWLYKEENVPQYLLGPAYFINGAYIKRILDAAADVPLINIEDIYFTYLVASAKLGLKLTHEPRMSAWKPAYALACAHWNLASVHSLAPDDLMHAWSRLAEIAKYYDRDKSVCSYVTYILWSLTEMF